MMNYYLNVALFFLVIFSVKAQTSFVNAQDSLRKVYVLASSQTENLNDENKAETGIYFLKQNKDNGKLKLVDNVASISNPTSVKVGKQGKFLYAVSKNTTGADEQGFIHTFKILENGNLTEMNKLSTSSWSPRHLALDQSGKFCLISSNGGEVRLYKIDTDGCLVPHQNIQISTKETAQLYGIKLSGDNRFAYIADYGNNKIWIYKFDAISGMLTAHEKESAALEAGAGPKNISLSRNGNSLYSVNELNSTISVFEIDKTGDLKMLEDVSTLPENYRWKNSATDIKMHPTGKFLYASNRGHNSISIFKIDAITGKLNYIGFTETLGKIPNSMSIAPLGKFLYATSQNSGHISSFKIDEETGKLKLLTTLLEIKNPAAIEIMN